MPKIVDAVERRRAVADAVFSVIGQRGLEGASLRNVAAEAGLAVGSVRHYFSGHDELLLFAMKEISSRFEQRVLKHVEGLREEDDEAERRRVTQALLSEFLPLDATRREEAAVWQAFVTAARTRPELQPRAREVLEGMRTVVERVLLAGQRTGGLPDSLDVELESVRLCALLDGLTVQAVQAPDLVPPGLLTDVLRRHLLALSGGG
jgi:AcrR family transcriptional regulator